MRIDPRSIKMITVFTVGIQFDHQSPLTGALVAFGALNRDVADYLLNHSEVLKTIHFLSDTFADATEAYKCFEKNMSRTTSMDAYLQYADVTVFGQRGDLLVATLVPGTGRVEDTKTALTC